MPYIGDTLMFFCSKVITLYNFFGKNAISICCFLFLVFPKIMFIFLILINITFPASLKYSIIFSLLLMKITKSFYNLIIDFSLKNKAVLNTYLIIRHNNNKVSYDFNDATVKNKTQEKLNLYVNRYRLFEETYSLCQSTLDYELKNIAPILNPTYLGFFICLNVNLLLSFFFTLPYFFYLILFIIIYILEYKNISQDFNKI